MALQCGRCGAAVQDFFASRCPDCGEALAPETLVRNENAPTIVSAPRVVEEESFGLPGEDSPEAIEAARTPRWQHAVQAAFGALFFALGGIYMYHRFSTWEVEGGTLYMPHLGWAMYSLLGKTGVALAFFAMSALFVYFAFGVCYDWPGCKRSEMES